MTIFHINEFEHIAYTGLSKIYVVFIFIPNLKVKVTQSCPTLCDPIDCSLPDSSVHGILQASILEWAAVPFYRASSQPRNRTSISCIAGGFLTS